MTTTIGPPRRDGPALRPVTECFPHPAGRGWTKLASPPGIGIAWVDRMTVTAAAASKAH